MPQPVVLLLSPPLTGESGDPTIGASKAERHQVGMFCVRHYFGDRPASVFNQPASLSANGSSLLSRSGTMNVGSIVPGYG